MLSTIFLMGLVIGFSIGRFIPSTDVKTNVMAEKGTGQTTGNTKSNTIGTPDTKETITTTPKVDYTSFKTAVTKDTHWTMGNPNAKVKIEEFSDFQCPFCERFYTQSYDQIIKNYVATGKVYYVFYNYPLDIHPQAGKAGEAALCAGDQNKYWEMHDLLFANQNFWSFQDNHLQTYELLAQGLNLNMDTYKNCVSTGKYANVIKKDTSLGEKKGVSGTPTFFINGTKIIGAQPYSTFASAIDMALTK